MSGLSVSAAVLRGAGEEFSVEELTMRPPRMDEVLVKIVSAGVCHTDAIVRAGDYPVSMPRVLGHEGAGVVTAIGPQVTEVSVGDHVVLSFVACGECSTCLASRPALCQQAFDQNFLGSWSSEDPFTDRDGDRVHGGFFGQSSFSTYALAPERSVVVIPVEFDLAIAGPLGCGIQTGAGAVLNSLQPDVGSSIAVFGAGAVGLSAVMAAVIAGCSPIIAVDLLPARRELALELGATHALDGAASDLVEQLRETSSGGLQFALDTTGRPDVVRAAIDALRVAGVFGLIGASATGTEVSLDLTHMLFGRIFRGIIEGDSVPRTFIPQLIEHHARGRFPYDRLIRAYGLDRIEQALADSETGLVVKPVIHFP